MALCLTSSAMSPDINSAVGAWRFAYVWYYRQSIPFPLVRQSEWYAGEPTYENADALQPGREENLDRICKIFMDGKPIYGPAEQRTAEVKTMEADVIGERIAHMTQC